MMKHSSLHRAPSLARLSFLLIVSLVTSLAYGANEIPKALEGVGIDQHLNQQVPVELPFVDEAGKNVRLADYLGKTPAILILAYYGCPRLCTLVMNGTGDALSRTGLKMGKDYQVITVSIDPKEGPDLAKTKKEAYIAKYGQDVASGWHFLTGTQASIQKLADIVGYHYRFDPKENQFLHASGIMALTPQGKLSHYFYGITYPFRDIRLALVEASAGKIGTAADKILIFCCSIDLTTGKYTASIFRIIQLICLSIVASLVTLLVVLHRYEPRPTES